MKATASSLDEGIFSIQVPLAFLGDVSRSGDSSCDHGAQVVRSGARRSLLLVALPAVNAVIPGYSVVDTDA